MNKTKVNLQLGLSDQEKSLLRKRRMKKADLLDLAPDELEVILEVSTQRARDIYALVEFQQIPSIGIRFAEDLIFLGYQSLESLKGKDGADLLNDYERRKGYQTDPCVEDQFRLVVDYANHRDKDKRWWHFTSERKEYRSKFGYPPDRPQTKWTEVIR